MRASSCARTELSGSPLTNQCLINGLIARNPPLKSDNYLCVHAGYQHIDSRARIYSSASLSSVPELSLLASPAEQFAANFDI